MKEQIATLEERDIETFNKLIEIYGEAGNQSMIDFMMWMKRTQSESYAVVFLDEMENIDKMIREYDERMADRALDRHLQRLEDAYGEY